MEHVREELDRLILKGGYGYASISRLLGRNPAYVQQFIKRGSPRKLDDEDRKTLACFFGVDEQVLGRPELLGQRTADGAVVDVPVEYAFEVRRGRGHVQRRGQAARRVDQ